MSAPSDDTPSLEEVTEGLLKLTKIENVDKTEIIQKAQKLIESPSEDDKKRLENTLEGIKDMRELSLAMGSPVPRILLAELIKCGKASNTQKKALMKKLPTLFTSDDIGCVEVKFYDTTEKKETRVYLVLDECGANHNLGTELEKLYSRISEEKQEEIRAHLSMLIYLGRASYAHTVNTNETFVREIIKHISDTYNPFLLGVDPKNTTIHSRIPNTKRVGIFVRFEKDVKK